MADVVVVVVVARRTRPRTMPLATMTMKTQTHGFLNFYPRTVVMGLRSAALRAAKELRYNVFLHHLEGNRLSMFVMVC